MNINTGGRARAGRLQINPVSVLDIGAGGTFELTASPAALVNVRNYILNAYVGGTWLGTNGITSTVARSDSRLGIGYRDNASLITIKLTLKGDTDLTGTVNFDDLLKLAQNYNGTGKFWFDGDFNYDANVNFDDLLSLAQNYNQTLSASQMSDLGSNFSSDWALATSMVPEPASASILLLAGPMLRRRRSIVK